jgi:hypothetical protein
MADSSKGAPGPDLSPETLRRVDILFHPEDRERAKALLYEQCGYDVLWGRNPLEVERVRFAALKVSDGKLSALEGAVKLGQQDFRDLLVAAGFANDLEAHRKWEPKPADEPAEIDPVQLGAKIHESLAAVLVPLGFQRDGDEWRRDREFPQTLHLLTGLTSRVDTKFFLKITLEAKPVIVFRLPKLSKNWADFQEQGYFFRAGGDQEALSAAVVEDVNRYALPLFQRFTSASEVQRGLEDGSFKPHLPVEGQIWIF